MGKAKRDKYLKDKGMSMLEFLPKGGRVRSVNGIKAIPREGTDDFVLLFGPREKEVMALLDLANGETFVDVGANVGGYTLKVASGNKSVNVIAIEAHPGNYHALRTNIECNGFTNVLAINKAVTDKIGKVMIYDRYKLAGNLCTGTATIDGSKDNTFNPIEVPCDTLDNVLANYAPDVVKMDIEGAEVSALKGATKTLGKVRRIIIEVHDSKIEEARSELVKAGLIVHEMISDGMPYLVGERK